MDHLTQIDLSLPLSHPFLIVLEGKKIRKKKERKRRIESYLYKRKEKNQSRSIKFSLSKVS